MAHLNEIKALAALVAVMVSSLFHERSAHSEGFGIVRSFGVERGLDNFVWNSRGSLWALDTVSGDFGGAEAFVPSLYWRGQSLSADYEFCSEIKDDRQYRAKIVGRLTPPNSSVGPERQFAVLGYGWRPSHMVSAMKGKYKDCPILFDEADSVFPRTFDMSVSKSYKSGHRLTLRDDHESLEYVEDPTFHPLASTDWRLSDVDAPEMLEKVCGRLSFNANGFGVFRCCNSLSFETEVLEDGRFRSLGGGQTAKACGAAYGHQNDRIAGTALRGGFRIRDNGKLIAKNIRHKISAVFEPVSWRNHVRGSWQLVEAQRLSQRLGAPLDFESTVYRDEGYENISLEVQESVFRLNTKCGSYFAPIVDTRKGILRLGKSKTSHRDQECYLARPSAIKYVHLPGAMIADGATIVFDHTPAHQNPSGIELLRVTRSGKFRAMSWTFHRTSD